MSIKNAFDHIMQKKVHRAVAACIILLTTAIGYGLFSDDAVKSCYALDPAQTAPIVIITSACVESTGPQCAMTTIPCETIGMTAIATNTASQAIKQTIHNIAGQVERQFNKDMDGVVSGVLAKVEGLEQNMISWWDTMWHYNLQPGLKKMTAQMNTEVVQQTQDIHKATDVREASEAKQDAAIQEAEDRKEVPVDDNGCATATVSGGLGRANTFGKAMRSGWQNRASDAGSNRRGTRGAQGRAAVSKSKSDTYESTFCDPNDNGGRNVCGPDTDPDFYNADTKATEILFNKKTIPVTNKKYQDATEAIMENMVGNPAADPMASDVLKVAPGREQFLNRRAFMARYAAAGSVPRIIAGWRMPGAGPDMGKWVAELRRGGAAVPFVTDKDLSANPSYREIVHAVTVDRFNSTGYASSLITEKNSIEMEKLTLSTFQLIMLRDYYELLERTALTLAVQVSMMADQQPMLRGSQFSKIKGD